MACPPGETKSLQGGRKQASDLGDAFFTQQDFHWVEVGGLRQKPQTSKAKVFWDSSDPLGPLLGK